MMAEQNRHRYRFDSWSPLYLFAVPLVVMPQPLLVDFVGVEVEIEEIVGLRLRKQKHLQMEEQDVV